MSKGPNLLLCKMCVSCQMFDTDALKRVRSVKKMTGIATKPTVQPTRPRESTHTPTTSTRALVKGYLDGKVTIISFSCAI
jgi:hypothetical protein